MSTRFRERFLLAVCFVVVGLVSSAALAAVPMDVLEGFQPRNLHHVQMLVITEYFQATPKEMKLAARELDSPDEMTAAFYLSRQSGKKMQRVLRLRSAGASWWEVMQKLDVASTWLYQGNMRSFQAMEHRKISLGPNTKPKPMNDARFEDLVGAHVTGEYFATAPSLVLEARAQGDSFRNIQFAFYHMGRGQAAGHMTSGSDDLRPLSARPQPRPNQPVKVDSATPLRPRTGQRPSFE